MDEPDRVVGGFVIVSKAVIEGLLFIKWDDRQEGTSHQCEVLGRIDAAVAVVVFHPKAHVLFVVVFVFDRPVGARLYCDLFGILRSEAAEEVAVVGFDFQIACFERFALSFCEVDPFAAHEGGALDTGQSDTCGA